jgi:hypothetical protein
LPQYTIKETDNTITDENGLSIAGNDNFILNNRGTANVTLQLDFEELEASLSDTGNTHL